ncbi:HlyC/CorC family transporter [Johnsonella ignava]|uniref:HlyC/CorC family transporter n=1 Tax=Johnsonella ignava TaxID=43995 RepID=UPI0023F39ACC|nr:hemolysin family protein [Johnsonella ignava]
MDNHTIWHIVILIILLGLSGFFSSAETAFTSSNHIKLRTLASKGNKNAVLVLKIMKKPEKMLSAVLIGNNIVNLSASALLTAITIKLFGNASIGAATGILTFLVLIFGEIAPKSFATKNAEVLVLIYAAPVYGLIFVLTPVIAAVNIAASAVLKAFGIDVKKNNEAMTEDELRTIVNVSHEEGVIENEERNIINNVFDFAGVLAKDVMVQRIDMVFIDINAGYDEIIEIYRQERYTRLPVYEGSTDNVVGIINIKDLLLYDKSEDFYIKDYMRKPLFTYEYKKLSELLLQMKKSYSNLAVVLDEYGITAGMVTMEDILEEIVGEIRDEYDTDEEDSFKKLGEGIYMLDGFVKLDEINERLGTNLCLDDYESIGGFVMGQLEHIPKVREGIKVGDVSLTVEKMDKARVDKVRLELLNKTQKL